VSREGLVAALWWWIPGILLVTGYFIFIHVQMRLKGASIQASDEKTSLS
jgi:hypothetical protein